MYTDTDVKNVIPRVCLLWLAPEVLSDPHKPCTPAADIFSLGVFLYEIITRNAPFDVDLSKTSEIEGNIHSKIVIKN